LFVFLSQIISIGIQNGKASNQTLKNFEVEITYENVTYPKREITLKEKPVMVCKL